MEWQIMNVDGLNGLTSSLGEWIGDSYVISDDCYDNLMVINEQLTEDDPVQRNNRRLLASLQVMQKDLPHVLVNVENDPQVFNLAIKLMVNLTQPIECLQQTTGRFEGQGHTVPSWYWDVQKMLVDSKNACCNLKFLEAVCTEMGKILDDSGEYDLIDEDCDTINQCLVLLRNLLHIQDAPHAAGISDVHMQFLSHMFKAGVDQILLRLLNTNQKDFWGVGVVQLISLLYKDLVGDIFMLLDDTSSCDEESCDSSNCSQCEAAMDRPFSSDSCLSSSCKSRGSSDRNSRHGSRHNGSSQHREDATIAPSSQCEMDTVVSSEFAPPLSRNFKQNCCITQLSQDGGMDGCSNCSQTLDENKVGSDMSSNVGSAGGDMLSFMSSKNAGCSAREELGSHLTEFTSKFLKTGFSNLVHVLRNLLLSVQGMQTELDDSYFLWSVAFFLKFARRKEIEFKNIKEVFTAEVFGFILYEAVRNGEEVLNLHKASKPCNLSMRRLHLCVSALRELLKTLTFHRDKSLSDEELQYLEKLQRDLANMSDLRQVFLWLIRVYLPNCHSSLFLRDVIVTNHYFLLLLEEWISKDFCENKGIDMLTHVKQFSTCNMMQKYGYLLQTFVKNDHHVNNCIFTMMHHVAGDCLHPESLLQVNILKTFLHIWDTEVPVTQEMNDLMEYVMQKFLSSAEDNPMSCALQLFLGTQEEAVPYGDLENLTNNGWTAEEEDKLIMWYTELENFADRIGKVGTMFAENGIKKSKIEIVNQLYKMGWISSEELGQYVKVDSTQHKGNTQGQQVEDDKGRKHLAALTELSQVEEQQLVPFCVKKLVADGYQDQVHFLQKFLLEAAYVKIDPESMDKKHLEEPVIKYFTMKGMAAPLVYYNDVEEQFGSCIYMIIILQQLGFSQQTGLQYPRLPIEWSVHDLVEKAQLMGELSKEDLKFDITSSLQQTAFTAISEPKIKFMSHKTPKAKSMAGTVPSALWMKFVGNFNTSAAAGGSVMAVGSAGQMGDGRKSMDTE